MNKTFYLNNYLKLTCSYLENSLRENYHAILILPGGGYEFLASDREGVSYANYFTQLGFVSFVIHYSIYPKTFPTQILEVYQALKFIKEEFNDVNLSDKLFIIGSSAGGHLALNSQTIIRHDDFLVKYHLKKDIFKVSGLVLCYPVINASKLITHGKTYDNLLAEITDQETISLTNLDEEIYEGMPKIFCYTTYQDDLIECENSLLLALSAKKHHVNLELHLYSLGQHGLSLGDKFNNPGTDEKVLNLVGSWPTLLKNWLKANFDIN